MVKVSGFNERTLVLAQFLVASGYFVSFESGRKDSTDALYVVNPKTFNRVKLSINYTEGTLLLSVIGKGRHGPEVVSIEQARSMKKLLKLLRNS